MWPNFEALKWKSIFNSLVLFTLNVSTTPKAVILVAFFLTYSPVYFAKNPMADIASAIFSISDRKRKQRRKNYAKTQEKCTVRLPFSLTKNDMSLFVSYKRSLVCRCLFKKTAY